MQDQDTVVDTELGWMEEDLTHFIASGSDPVEWWYSLYSDPKQEEEAGQIKLRFVLNLESPVAGEPSSQPRNLGKQKADEQPQFLGREPLASSPSASVWSAAESVAEKTSDEDEHLARFDSSARRLRKNRSRRSTLADTGIPSRAGIDSFDLDRVITFLAENGFSKEWQETFRSLDITGRTFFDLGTGSGGRGNFGFMHQRIFPQLAKLCLDSGFGWDQVKERVEAKRLRQLIRDIDLVDDPSIGPSAKPSTAAPVFQPKYRVTKRGFLLEGEVVTVVDSSVDLYGMFVLNSRLCY